MFIIIADSMLYLSAVYDNRTLYLFENEAVNKSVTSGAAAVFLV